MSLRSVYNWWVHGNGRMLIPPVWYIFFAVLTISCHLLVPFVFKIETVEIRPIQQRPRSNKAISMSNPTFTSFCANLPKESDPTIFIRGGHGLGYSRFLTLSEEEELDAASSVRPPLTPLPSNNSLTHPGSVSGFDPASIPQLFTGVLAEGRLAAPAIPAVPVHYPAWIDSRGIISALKNAQAEEQRKKLFSSRDVTGPTKLRVILRQGSDFPPGTEIVRSSGSTTLDFYAKQELDEFLAKPENAARFDEGNDMVRVYWNANAPVLHADSGMSMFFRREEEK